MTLWGWRQAMTGFAEFHAPPKEPEPGEGAPTSEEHRARVARVDALLAAKAEG